MLVPAGIPLAVLKRVEPFDTVAVVVPVTVFKATAEMTAVELEFRVAVGVTAPVENNPCWKTLEPAPETGQELPLIPVCPEPPAMMQNAPALTALMKLPVMAAENIVSLA